MVDGTWPAHYSQILIVSLFFSFCFSPPPPVMAGMGSRVKDGALQSLLPLSSSPRAGVPPSVGSLAVVPGWRSVVAR
uniref:Secreted protein n=1 Tax=Zea mays TaxID=4577 RepID=B6T5L6_MAIZE|nr:hypothetical protein [Zea mays]